MPGGIVPAKASGAFTYERKRLEAHHFLLSVRARIGVKRSNDFVFVERHAMQFTRFRGEAYGYSLCCGDINRSAERVVRKGKQQHSAAIRERDIACRGQ